MPYSIDPEWNRLVYGAFLPGPEIIQDQGLQAAEPLQCFQGRNLTFDWLGQLTIQQPPATYV